MKVKHWSQSFKAPETEVMCLEMDKLDAEIVSFLHLWHQVFWEAQTKQSISDKKLLLFLKSAGNTSEAESWPLAERSSLKAAL